jgi:hypothetical protein
VQDSGRKCWKQKQSLSWRWISPQWLLTQLEDSF